MTFPIIAKLAGDADKFCNYFVFFVETVFNEKSWVTMKLTCLAFNKMKKDVERFEGKGRSHTEEEASDSTQYI